MQLSNIIFLLTFVIAISFFVKNLNKIISNIKLGKDINRSDNKEKVYSINLIELIFNHSLDLVNTPPPPKTKTIYQVPR